MPKIALVQHPSVLGDRDATLDRAASLAEEAVAGGAALVVFPEAYVPGYPTYAWRLRPGGDMGLSNEIHAWMLKSAVDLTAGHLRPLTAVAEKHGVDILVGIDEIDSAQSRSTLFNSYVHIENDGAIANVHRKLMPTNPERMVWGFGDARGLRVVQTPVGRVGSLICWENFMPLARMALYAQGIDLYLAPTWDSSDGWVGTMQHIAREGRCYVASCCSAMRGSDVPSGFPGRDQLFADPDERINRGMSLVAEPGGRIIAGPLDGEPGILYAEVDADRARASRRSLDVAGHYNRPDVFSFEVDRRPQTAAHFDD